VRTSDFDYELPSELIAQHPAERRDASRLMIVDRQTGAISHRLFADLTEWLVAGDVLVRNNSRVIAARLIGRRVATGGHWEGLYLRTESEGAWEILAKTRGKPVAGETIALDTGLTLRLLSRTDEGTWIVRPDAPGDTFTVLDRYGHIPLPPYIRKGIDAPADRERYQTEFATLPGSVAAPTAGLHFTGELLTSLQERGVGIADLTLHVGLGTFRPIETDTIDQHKLHREYAQLSAETADRLNHARRAGQRIVAVGTTSTRTLETAVDGNGTFAAFCGETGLYIKPGHRFRAVDALITNFHLPRSSLLVLVAAFAGYDLMRQAYRVAVAERYRFYSYGDAMLIV
jgi:S-adenosylmethionine:tRNA ribosyltransferase-isomerase